VIAAVTGDAVGHRFELTLWCDLRVLEELPVAIREVRGQGGGNPFDPDVAPSGGFRVFFGDAEGELLIENQRAPPLLWKRP
jgi:hypothetical protein